MQALSESGVVAVIRAKSADQLIGIAEALLAGGVLGVEVTMSTPKAISGIEQLADKFGDKAVIGVGTVLDGATAADAIHAGGPNSYSPRAISPTSSPPPANMAKSPSPAPSPPPKSSPPGPAALMW